ncbi:PAS domain S-box protein [Pontibacter sp. H249]|uniref:PAS domain S-box protein n=1 Tax=Pontibacter sp. H249 TaxID=3133420 RepID=UPI0030C093E6
MGHLHSDFYKHLLLNSTDLLSVIDETGVYKYVGDSVTAILGYTASEMVGKNALSYIHPDDLDKAVSVLQKVVSTDKIVSPPYRFMSKYNGWRWIESTVTNLLHDELIQGFVTNSKDITETISQREEKDLHQAYYISLYEAHPDVVFMLDIAGNFTSVNKQFKNKLGYQEDAVLKEHFLKLVHPDDFNYSLIAFKKTLEGESQDILLKVLDVAGKVRVMSIAVLPVSVGGTIIGVQGIAKDVTVDIEHQHLIKAHSEQLRKILNSVTEPFFALDANWCYTFANQAYCNHINKEAKEFIGLVIWEVFPGLMDKDFYLSCLQVEATGKTEYLEETYDTNGHLTLSYSIFPFDGGLAIHFIDTTAKSALHREMEKLSFVASKTINGVVIMDPQGRIEWVNDGFTRLSGYLKEEVIGKVPSQLLQGYQSDTETENYIRQKYKEQEHFTAEILNYRKTGEPYWVNIDVTPIKDATGELVNYIALQTDITEKKKADAEQLKLADDLYKQNLNLQQFTYMVSHNLRAPVANALGLSRLARKVQLGTGQFDNIMDKLEMSITQLDNVIKDINSILSIKDADRTLPRENVNLLNIVEEVLSPFQDELSINNAKVTLAIDCSYTMLSNKAYLYSIVQNLVSNAIKYRSPERLLQVEISVSRDARGYVLSVSDNGLGMDMELVQNQLFKLYKRFHPNTHGKGIGLFLVKTQVETIGGKILVKSEPGAGTTFTLLLGNKHVQ